MLAQCTFSNEFEKAHANKSIIHVHEHYGRNVNARCIYSAVSNFKKTNVFREWNSKKYFVWTLLACFRAYFSSTPTKSGVIDICDTAHCVGYNIFVIQISVWFVHWFFQANRLYLSVFIFFALSRIFWVTTLKVWVISWRLFSQFSKQSLCLDKCHN